MKAIKAFSAIVALIFALVLPSGTATPQKGTCTTIQSGGLLYSIGHFLYGVQPLKPGFDVFGYNYQAHLFNGYYCNAYFGAAGLPPYEGDSAAYLAAHPSAASHWAWPYRDTIVAMKWNDAWLSNMDCDKDGKLDRHLGFPTYRGSGAWETNHMSGTYIGDDGKECHWNYFVKIVAAPEDAVKVNGIWYTAEGEIIGPDIWGEFVIIQEVSNDPCLGDHGLLSKSPIRAGLGNW